jgi:ketosteroid isomerase-like protein
VRLIDGETGELKRMFVSPAVRGKGVGRRLVDALEAEARALGARRLVLETGTRQTAALALYRATGFQPIPLYGEYVNSPDTSVCMGKEIGGVMQNRADGDGGVSRNRRTIERYMEGFRRSDHAEILDCLTDDVEWVIPGMARLAGKEAFDREIENPAFTGRPTITVTRMVEEHDVVVAEGSVQSTRSDGGTLSAVFCDVFEMRDGRIARLTSYLVDLSPRG